MLKQRSLLQFIILGIVALLLSCGNMDTLITNKAPYSLFVYAGIRNLDDGAVLHAEDSIRPALDSAVRDDPDARGIRVSLKNIEGLPVAGDVEYRLDKKSRSPEDQEGIIYVGGLDGILPSFTLPKDLEVGLYVLTVQVLGENVVLFERQQEVYYLADANLSLDSLQSYPPGTEPSAAAPVFPSNILLMLEAKVDFDPRLKPYIIWSSAGKTLSSSYLDKGGNYLLWKTPSESGFHSVRAEIYPEMPKDLKRPKIAPQSLNLRLAISNQAPIPGFKDSAFQYDFHYRLMGTLNDELSPDESNKSLVPVRGNENVWVKMSDTYGLQIGSDDAFKLAPAIQPISENMDVKKTLLTRLSARSTGLIWRLSFEPSLDTIPLNIEFLVLKDSLALHIFSRPEEAARTVLIPLTLFEAQLVSVTFSKDAEDLLLSFESNLYSRGEDIRIPLENLQLEEALLQLGGESLQITEIPQEIDRETLRRSPVAVIDELALESNLAL
ncbi:hypothetical protein MASR2M78_34420 [Treponema sp.]